MLQQKIPWSVNANRVAAAAVFLVVCTSLSRTGAIAQSPTKLSQTTSLTKSASDQPIQYGRDIRPLLSDRCFLCHGPDEAGRQAELRLDQRDAATKSAITPGNAQTSELVARIATSDLSLRMPPPDSGKRPLTPEEVTRIKRWINEDAIYEAHWAFVTPSRPNLPPARRPSWNEHPIDRLVLAKLTAQGWDASPPADRRTLLRRAAFDLTGLPPTPAQLDSFLSDKSPEAWSNALDRLLASPAYGEHQTRYWLDVARYADSHGYQYDFQREQWAWRDWVIHAFNENMPFDQFTIEQLAGDLLPQATAQQRLATGFNRNHPITIEGGVIDEEYRTEYVIDRTTTTGATWLGLTLGCARCHDHKFDPLSQKEFYQLTAFFNQVPEKGFKGFAPQEQIPSPFQLTDLQKIKTELRQANREFNQLFQSWNPDVEAIERDIFASQVEHWQIARPISISSRQGTPLSTLDDGSLLAGGKVADQDVYELTLPVADAPIHGIRLIALPDTSTPSGGLGRSSNGNFVLSEVVAEFVPQSSEDEATTLTLTNAQADFSQPNYDVSLAIDGKIDQQGWAIHGRQQEQLTADFSFPQPLVASPPGKLRLQLHFASQYPGHQFGRFQVALAGKPILPKQELDVAALSTPRRERSDEQQANCRSLVVNHSAPDDVRNAWARVETLQSRRQQLQASVPQTMIMQDIDEPRGAYVLHRGEYDKRGEHVDPNTPSMLPPFPADFPRNRLGFARWLTMPNHPLTARVIVNRFWGQLFGIGLNETPEDFGLQSAEPLHLDLLDWLAVEFVESGWDVKALLKTIMISQTYRQDSTVTPASYARDPQNRYLSRGPRLRLDAETIRDAALAVSGLLNRHQGGPSVYPYHPPGLWIEVNNRPGFSKKYERDSGEKLYRRSLYTFWKRTVPPPSLAVFDAPAREYCRVQRSRTNTPLQAFVLLHDPQFVEAARALAEQMISKSDSDLHEQIRFGMELSVGRPPTDQEMRVLHDTYQERLARYQKNPEQGKMLLSVGESPRDESLPVPQHAAMTAVARLLLNLSEFITKG